jgi:hypothetical protein
MIEVVAYVWIKIDRDHFISFLESEQNRDIRLQTDFCVHVMSTAVVSHTKRCA